MDLIEKLPEMDDAALAALHTNALRLEKSGTNAQQRAATDLLPALTSEIAQRKEAKQAATTAKMQKAREAAAARRKAAKDTPTA